MAQRYQSKRSSRRRKIVAARIILIITVLLLLALLSYFISKRIDGAKAAPESGQTETTGGTVISPKERLWLSAGPQRQDTPGQALHTPSYEEIALPENGRVDMKYFNDATFLGDSITIGLHYFNIIPNAYFCAYEGISPKSVYDGTLHKNQNDVQEIPIEAVKATNPRNLYILIGTNAQIAMDNESILLYYDEMLKQLRESLGGDVNIYVQSVTPVLVNTPRFDINRIDDFNRQLAQLAWKHNVYFLDIASALRDSSGYMKEEYGTPDGYHINRDGDIAWLEYLITHTAYSKDNQRYYLEGSSPQAS